MAINEQAFRTAILAQINAAGRGATREDLKVVMAKLVDELQGPPGTGYKGQLKLTAPTDATFSREMTLARWSGNFVFMVLDHCNRHNRTEAQVTAAISKVLAAG